jgi:hypothetical protein
MVHELIDPTTGQWSEEVLSAKMAPVDREAILKIPIGRLEEDTWAWQLERHGNFTVRSAYRALLNANAFIEPLGSSGSVQPYWQKLWKMRVPPKVRNYWWRVIKGFIPCRAVLEARHIERISFCHECGCKDTIQHSLFECTWAKLFWQEVKATSAVKVSDLHPDTWVIDIIDSNKVDPRDAAMILCGGWAVWRERNARKHGESTRSIIESVKWAYDIMSDIAITSRAIK